jgi:hypothetical protein
MRFCDKNIKDMNSQCQLLGDTPLNDVIECLGVS